ncbi:MAG: hypothetical protein IKR49_00570 [Clostridia bacterium]|jgi:hypothetical protein|nr:hypothetical protein [Clostridia bacterium]
MFQDLFIPRFEWLIGGSRIGGSYNVYYGSQTEHPEQAAWGQRIFNYAIYIEKPDDTEYLRAAVWSGLRTLKDCPEEDVTREVFDCEEGSLPQIEAWLTARRDAFFAAV